MPWFKHNGTVFHVKMAKRRTPKCRFCHSPASLECDGVLSRNLLGEEKVCDAPICARCATQFGDDKDLCPTCKGR